jgi:hypothetical protein
MFVNRKSWKSVAKTGASAAIARIANRADIFQRSFTL